MTTTAKLTWYNDSEAVLRADSKRSVDAPYASGYYTIEKDSGSRIFAPDRAPGHSLTYTVEDETGDEYVENDFGRYPTRAAAKKVAERYERTGERPAPQDPFTAEQLTVASDAIAAVWNDHNMDPASFARAALTALAGAGHIRA